MIELPENVRIPLHELQADADYLFGRVAADGTCASAMATSVKSKLAALEAAIREPQKDDWFQNLCAHFDEGGQIGEVAARELLRRLRDEALPRPDTSQDRAAP